MLNDGTVLGWDRLSAWPFNGPWNSRIGKNARQGVEIMEGRRGRLVAHLCSDTAYLAAEHGRAFFWGASNRVLS